MKHCSYAVVNLKPSHCLIILKINVGSQKEIYWRDTLKFLFCHVDSLRGFHHTCSHRKNTLHLTKRQFKSCSFSTHLCKFPWAKKGIFFGTISLQNVFLWKKKQTRKTWCNILFSAGFLLALHVNTWQFNTTREHDLSSPEWEQWLALHILVFP